MTLNDLVKKIGDAIERQEGFRDANGQPVTTSAPFKRQNPGSIWDGFCPGKLKRIWPHLPIDASGFVIYPNYPTGRSAMEHQIQMKISNNETLQILIEQWDSSDPAPTRALYVAHVAEWTGLPVDQSLKGLVTA